MRTPWRLLDLVLTCIYWVLEPLHASSKEAKAAVLRIRVVFGNLEKYLRDVESTWHLMGPLSKELGCRHAALDRITGAVSKK